MKLKIILVFVLLTSCTLNKSTTATPQTEPKSCSDYTSIDECDRDPECRSRYGIDAATADDVYLACTRAYPNNTDCSHQTSCYTNSSGQRAIANKCDYPRWTEVECTAEELAPCKYTTTETCEADKRCLPNMAKDLATKESIPMGCGYKRGLCSDAITCYINKLTGSRVMASSICDTPFPEWEYTECTEADFQAFRAH
jgi:hypothetical protein